MASKREFFNWGYHDAAQDIRMNWGIRTRTHGAFRRAIPLPTWNLPYTVGYEHGIEDARSNTYTGNSENAWVSYHKR